VNATTVPTIKDRSSPCLLRLRKRRDIEGKVCMVSGLYMYMHLFKWNAIRMRAYTALSI
jgi:hypothetical protein